MNTNSNAYTVSYVAIMVIVVAALLAFTASALKDRISANKEIDNKIEILSSVKIESDFSNADELYAKHIKSEIEVKDGKKIFECEKDGQTYFIAPVEGQGLWGKIWGYIALENDKNTVYGAYFSHQGETPGLGAEIATPSFQKQFEGKKIFKNGEFTSIAIVKPGKTADGKDYVDGISGGTLTCQGVDKMLSSSLECYLDFLKK